MSLLAALHRSNRQQARNEVAISLFTLLGVGRHPHIDRFAFTVRMAVAVAVEALVHMSNGSFDVARDGGMWRTTR